MNFKPGDMVICIKDVPYSEEDGLVKVGEIYEVDERHGIREDGIWIKREIPKYANSYYNWFPEHFFRSAGPELFHNSLEKLSE